MMKKSLFILLFCTVCMGGWAQENGVFVSAGVGTQMCDKAFHGADVSMQAGYNYKGLDISAQLGYFSNSWGSNALSVQATEMFSAGTLITNNAVASADKDRDATTHLSIRLNLGYDVLRFIQGNWRHHVRPYVGVGYAQARESYNRTVHSSTTRVFTWQERTERGFELTLGLGYDVGITHPGP